MFEFFFGNKSLILKLLLSYSILIATSSYFVSNIKYLNNGGTGYPYLYATLVLFFILFTTSSGHSFFRKIKISMFLFSLFFSYLIFNYLFDTANIDGIPNIAMLKSITIGTTGGIIFALGLGFIVSYTISIIYDIKLLVHSNKYFYLLAIFFLLCILAIALDAYLFLYKRVSPVIFLILNNEFNHQRAGVFLFMQSILLTSLVVNVLLEEKSSIVSFIAHAFIIFQALFLAFFSQLIFSNSGVMTILAFLFIYIFYYIYIYLKNSDKKKLFLFFYLSFFVFLAFILLDFDFSKLRIFNYGMDSKLFIGRINFFLNNFIQHFNYNPIFGNTQVDVITTGAGTYIHSWLAILTHLGFIGFILFLAFIFQIYREINIKDKPPQNHSLYENPDYGLFRMMALSSVLIMGFFTAFYTWMPLWFAIGLFGIGLCRESRELSV